MTEVFWSTGFGLAVSLMASILNFFVANRVDVIWLGIVCGAGVYAGIHIERNFINGEGD